jgi:hypothetical protein
MSLSERRGPRVSVLMPTYRQAWSIKRSIASLRAQSFTEWELIVVDDGSPDDTGDQIREIGDDRIRYHRLEKNHGLGHALNTATAMARGDYLAYLPSDDVFFPDHLHTLVTLLDSDPAVYLAYSGVQSHSIWHGWRGLTLHGDDAVGRESEILSGARSNSSDNGMNLPSGNLLALVQVMHRRLCDQADFRWPVRAEIVSDSIELDRWRAVAEAGLRFACTDTVTCEWTDHYDQRHKIIAEVMDGSQSGPSSYWISGRGLVPEWISGRGLAAYRTYYQVGPEPLNWKPTVGRQLDERERYEAESRPRSESEGSRILIVGELGFNPDRLRAFTAGGHELYGLWTTALEPWDSVGSLPVADVQAIPHDAHWKDRVREVAPDFIYALLNVQAIPLIHEVATAGLGIPLFFQFKESPFHCIQIGLWEKLRQIFAAAAGHLFISEENREWFAAYCPDVVGKVPSMILDGDLPLGRWMTDEWSDLRSDADSEIHTACAGRPAGLDDFSFFEKNQVHIHIYGSYLQRRYPALATGHRYIHMHETVDPKDWVRELSQYDAAWLHGFQSSNGGEVRSSTWSELNIPARLGTYAAAGLPWIIRAPAGSRTSVGSLAQRHGCGVMFDDFDELAKILRDRDALAAARAGMRAERLAFSFDYHVDSLIKFFKTGSAA